MFDKEKFASGVYVSLLNAYGIHKSEEWLVDESIRRANVFEDALKATRPAKQKAKRAVVRTA